MYFICLQLKVVVRKIPWEDDVKCAFKSAHLEMIFGISFYSVVIELELHCGGFSMKMWYVWIKYIETHLRVLKRINEVLIYLFYEMNLNQSMLKNHLKLVQQVSLKKLAIFHWQKFSLSHHLKLMFMCC